MTLLERARVARAGHSANLRPSGVHATILNIEGRQREHARWRGLQRYWGAAGGFGGVGIAVSGWRWPQRPRQRRYRAGCG